MVKTDNVVTNYFQGKKKLLSPKQARWQDFLTEFKYVLEYNSLVADSLSRKAKFAAMSRIQGELLTLIKEGMEHDPLAKQLVSLVQ